MGHSTHTWQRFADLVRSSGVTAIADVRSSPYSRHTPHFSRETLKQGLHSEGMAYSFLGKELGGRPSRRDLYANGIADYEAMARTSAFIAGLNRVVSGAERYRVALLCAEHDPLDCHRCLLVGRHLNLRGAQVRHILADRSVVSHAELEDHLLRIEHLSSADFFMSRSDRLAAAYRERSRRVAYTEASQPTSGQWTDP